MTAQLASPPIGAAELQKLLTDIDPAALVVAPRLLRRVIKEHCQLGGMGLEVPHRKSYTIGRDALLAIADRIDLGLSNQRELPDKLVLLACPENWLTTHTREQALLEFWRLLFHAHIDLAVEARIADGKLTLAIIRELLFKIGFVEAEEAFRVLRHENYLLPPDDLDVRFKELAAVFLELRYFARPLLPRFFPCMEDLAHTESILSDLVHAPELFRKSRPAGAPDPVMDPHDSADDPGEEGSPEAPVLSGLPNAARCQVLLARADRAAQRGNVVRAAMLRTRAADVAPPELLDSARKGAMADIERLVSRLQSALELHDREADEWLSALRALLGPASHGLWPPSARLLYDLQKVCVDHERDLYALDLVEWVASFFRKPIKRPVPLQADVLLVKHLRRSATRLSRARIGEEDRRRLAILLRSAIHHCEDRLREKIRPVLTDSLLEVGFHPENEPERVSLQKIVEELLDRVTESGFLNMGHVRDALSRNQLKLPDVTVRELLVGDRLLKANRKLALTIDGVYHRGEIYLRWLQRFSSLLFGTVLGRWLTLYVLLPFGGSFALIIFWQEMVHLGHVTLELFAEKPPLTAGQSATLVGDLASPGGFTPLTAAATALQPPPKQHHYPSPWTILFWGVVVFLVLHVPPFRARLWQVTKKLWKGVRGVLIDAPAAFFHLPAVKAFFVSPGMLFFHRRLLVPLLLGLLAAVVCLYLHVPGPFDNLAAFLGTFLGAFLLFSSRVGRRAEEAATDWLARNWYWLRVEAVRGLIAWLIWFFKEVMDRVERVLYTVDEWLRFRHGDSKLGLFYKPLLGLIWFFLTYLIRIVINLMVEPTVNPIKHFPAVTVGAKLIIPMIPAWSVAMTRMMEPFLGLWMAGAVAGTLIILIPGVFGFAAWELKENWRLYRANRKKELTPVMIGHHGETMLRLLRRGFHSGTLPKLHAKLRQAERHGDGRKIYKHHEALHHVRESVGRFVERDLFLFLEQSRSWGGLRLLLGEIKAATNRVRIEVRCPDLDETGLWMTFEERSGRLVAAIQRPGWLGRLSAAQSAAFVTALAGMYKKAGVNLVREQIEEQLPPDTSAYTFDERGLVLFVSGDFGREEVWPLTEPANGQSTPRWDRLLFSRFPLLFADWVTAWDSDRAGGIPDLPLLHSMRLLPRINASPSPGLTA